MDNKEFIAAQAQLCTLTKALSRLDLNSFVKFANSVEDLVTMLEPFVHFRGVEELQDIKRLASAAMPVWNAVNQLAVKQTIKQLKKSEPAYIPVHLLEQVIERVTQEGIVAIYEKVNDEYKVTAVRGVSGLSTCVKKASLIS